MSVSIRLMASSMHMRKVSTLRKLSICLVSTFIRSSTLAASDSGSSRVERFTVFTIAPALWRDLNKQLLSVLSATAKQFAQLHCDIFTRHVVIIEENLEWGTRNQRKNLRIKTSDTSCVDCVYAYWHAAMMKPGNDLKTMLLTVTFLLSY